VDRRDAGLQRSGRANGIGNVGCVEIPLPVILARSESVKKIQRYGMHDPIANAEKA
jgi:hypothetical protein